MPLRSRFLRALFDCALAAADPASAVAQCLSPQKHEKTYVVGAGKAAFKMAEAVERLWGASEGLVIGRYGDNRNQLQGLVPFEASHPVPDLNGVRATENLLLKLQDLEREDNVLFLLSGGASALLVAPISGVTLAQKQEMTRALLASGAPIHHINAVRKRLSRVKGGGFAAAAYPARVQTLIISDVPGDDLAFIGSGPTAPDETTSEEALDILARYAIPVTPEIKAAITRSEAVIRVGDPRLSRVENVIIAAPSQSLKAASAMAQEKGRVESLGDALEGEARCVAEEQGRLALQIQSEMTAGDPPCFLLSGGELTVTHRGTGRGGPNAEFCLSLAITLKGALGISAIACDTDGVDGSVEVAGAIMTPETLEHARRQGISPEKSLENHDSHAFFEAVGGQVITGATGTNVNDFRAVMITKRS